MLLPHPSLPEKLKCYWQSRKNKPLKFHAFLVGFYTLDFIRKYIAVNILFHNEIFKRWAVRSSNSKGRCIIQTFYKILLKTIYYLTCLRFWESYYLRKRRVLIWIFRSSAAAPLKHRQIERVNLLHCTNWLGFVEGRRGDVKTQKKGSNENNEFQWETIGMPSRSQEFNSLAFYLLSDISSSLYNT